MKLLIAGSRSFAPQQVSYQVSRLVYGRFADSNFITTVKQGWLDNQTGQDLIYSYNVVLNKLSDQINNLRLEPTLVISGGAMGVDIAGEIWATLHDVPIKIYRPDWKNLGKVAGFIRNTEMVQECNKVLVLWDGVSRGTKDTVSKAQDLNKDLYLVLGEGLYG